MNTGLITRLRNIVLIMLTVTATVAGSYSARASHFRGSTVSWSKHPTLSNTIIINSESSIRKSSGNYSGAIGTMVSNGTLNLNPFSVAGLSILVTYSSDGTTNTTTTATLFSHTGKKIVDNSIEDYITVEMGRIENGVWTPGILVEYISFVPHHIGFQQVCCRVSTLNANYEEKNYGAYVDLISVNSAPKSGSPAVLQVPRSQIMNGGTWTYQLSASDADNDIIRYRVGTTDFGGQVNFEFGNSFSGSEA